MPWKLPVHRPVGWRDKAERDRDYAQRRDRVALALYRSAAWRKARREFLVVHPACASCGRIATVVDHIDPHRGDPAIFWNRCRWQSLCASCHGRKTAAQDGGFANRRLRGMGGFDLWRKGARDRAGVFFARGQNGIGGSAE